MPLSTFLRRNIVSTLIVALVASIAFLLFVDVTRTSGRGLGVTRIDPYVLCTGGKVIVRSGDTTTTLAIRERADLHEEDRVRTLAQSSATIFWPDGSRQELGIFESGTYHAINKVTPAPVPSGEAADAR